MTEADRSIISSVREGMTVVDCEDSQIGTVELVKIADPEVTTTRGQRQPTEEQSAPGVGGAPLASPGLPAGVPGSVAGGVPGTTGVPVAPPGFLSDGGGSEPDLPPALAERLLREGFVKVDSKGLFRRDLYVGANEITQVDDQDVVHLSAPRNELAKES